jgi:hypothetical protein
MNEIRYNCWHEIGNHDVKFYLSEYTPDIEECRVLFLKIIEQAKRDLVNLVNTTSPSKKEIWEEARQFLFEDDYTIDWDDRELTFTEITEILNLDVDWVRKMVIQDMRVHLARRMKSGKNKEVRPSDD